MKINLEMYNLKFIWDTKTGLVEVYKPIRKIGAFRLDNNIRIDYQMFQREVINYMTHQNRDRRHDISRTF